MSEPRSRRRGEQLEKAILDAAWDELREVGYSNLTMERVASRAGTSKPVIYRRWGSRAELVLAAWGRQVPGQQEPPDTGSLRSDLIALFTMIAQRASSVMSEVIAGVMGEAFRHPEITALLTDRLKASPLTETIRPILARASARGELPEVELSPRAGRVPLDLIRNETLLCRGPISEETIAEVVDDVYLPLLRGLAKD